MQCLLVNLLWYKNMNVQILNNKRHLNSFLKNNRGSVTIEFVVMLLVLLFMLVFMADLAILRSNMGKLDNLSYSLVNVLRERTQLYGKGHEAIQSPEVGNFRKLAKGMFFGDPESDKELYIVLNSIQFKNTTTPTEKPQIKNNITLGDTAQCTPTTNLKDVDYIAPRSEINNNRIIPLYQVTVCIPSYSIFKAIIAGDASAGRTLRSSSIAVGR